MNKKLIVIMFNELDFKLLEKYCSILPGKFKNFEALFRLPTRQTGNHYVKNNEIEPWIVWPSFFNGKSYKKHKIFRLNEFFLSKYKNISEILESQNIKVGSIGAMNIPNRLVNPDYFISDMWITTKPDKNHLIHSIQKALTQGVKNNESLKLSLSSIFYILVGLLISLRVRNIFTFMSLGIQSIKDRYIRALWLDYYINNLHYYLFNKNKTNFSTVFFNAGAHIQHHKYNNSIIYKKYRDTNSKDYFLKILKVYDKILGDYIHNKSFEFIVLNGLMQKQESKGVHYYRLNDPDIFFDLLGIDSSEIHLRMSKDMTLHFDSTRKVKVALSALRSVKINNENVFGDFAVFKNKIYLSITFNKEIKNKNKVKINNLNLEALSLFNLIAIKNGSHISSGTAYFSQRFSLLLPKRKIIITEFFNLIIKFFKM
ncbi:hypothetical protein [Candidatus Methylopumilus universalis]|uniref:hypothetical protein n=1 Tax=Candidatus Methylopumilus universalis TaxID=2588536 RepID=UPI003BEF3F51